MAVVIRMKRTGRRNRPFYRIAVADSAFPCDGRTLDNLGTYDPISKDTENQVKIDVDRARHWLKLGALPSDTVRYILKKEGAFEGVPVKPKRERTGRSTETAKGKARVARNADVTKAKEARRAERLKVKYTARREAKAAAAAEGGE